jgi:hypothetical protein
MFLHRLTGITLQAILRFRRASTKTRESMGDEKLVIVIIGEII